MAITLHCHRYRSNTAVYHPLLYCCFSPLLGWSWSSLVSNCSVCVCVCVGGVIWHSQLSEVLTIWALVLTKPGPQQERGWKWLFGLLIALASWNPFHPLQDVNCPFPFPSDQGGHDKTNCRPVILSTQGPVSQKTALTFG